MPSITIARWRRQLPPSGPPPASTWTSAPFSAKHSRAATSRGSSTPQDSGLASGLINTTQQVGGALGLAVLATFANSRTDDLVADAGGSPAALPNALTEGFQTAFLGGAGLAVLGILAASLLIRSRDSRSHAQQAQSEPQPAAAIA